MKLNLTEKIYIRRWAPCDSPVGMVQIIHGMGEHSSRYDDFARFLSEKGYLVVAADHRGHGSSVEDVDEVGRIDLPFETLVSDQVDLTSQLREEFPNLPIYILGHSMGSFIAQGHLKSTGNNIAAYILSGSCKVSSLRSNLGAGLGRLITSIRGNKRSKLMNKLLFAGYNKGIEDRATGFDWLSRDKEIVKDYVSDPYCGFVYTSAFYTSFLSYLTKLFQGSSFISVDTTLPIFILSGERDPVGLYGRGVRKLADFYKELGFTNVRVNTYPEGRHEILNEINKLEVYADILNFLETHI